MKKTISKILLPFAMVVGGSNVLWAPPTPIWQVVGSAGFGGTGFNGVKNLTMALDSNSIPYVAFVNSGNYDNATVMKFNNSSWVQLGSTLPSYAETSSTSIAINSTGTPYVAYIAPDKDYLGYWVNVFKHNGSNWVNEGNADFGTGGQTHLTIDSSDTPLVSYNDWDYMPSGTVKKLSGSSWPTVGSAGIIGNPVVVTDSQNTPYVVDGYAATVKKFNGTFWETVGTENFAPGTVSNCSIALNSKDEPYVAFVDGDSSDKISVMKFNGTSWVFVGSQGFTSTASYNLSLAIDASDTPYIAYSDYDGMSQEAMVMKFAGSNWVVVGEAKFSSQNALDISLAINKSGVPYVSYKDGNIYNRATVMYAPSITCAYKNQGDASGECIPGMIDQNMGDYPAILVRNYVQGDINQEGVRMADSGWEGAYPTLCRDEYSQQGSDNCP